jgi:3-isopropylmalate dehydrogenase
MFAPVHGAAHDIAGTGKANPVAAIRSAALMLDFLGGTDAAASVTAAVTEFINSTPGATLSTTEIGDAIAARL